MINEPRPCPLCGDTAFLDSRNEIECHSCSFVGNPQIVFPVCPICMNTSLDYCDNKVACSNNECGYSATAGDVSLVYIKRILGYDANANQPGEQSQYAIYCPDCNGDAVYDFERDVVLCYSCGGGWTNHQFMRCAECGEIRLNDEMYDNICTDCKDWEGEDDNNDTR